MQMSLHQTIEDYNAKHILLGEYCANDPFELTMGVLDIKLSTLILPIATGIQT